ncbi:MAG: ABC transporter substrate-binding protein [Candidatus Latescibacteria bacterium]|nr:ABC transporter substrate-binding protein [Candidatus Latescibacterota bacterium]
MRAMTRRSLLRAGLTGCLVAPWWHALRAFADRLTKSGVTDTEIILGTSAAFSGPSRGLGIELYRGAGAYFTHVNQQGGIAGRTVQVKAYPALRSKTP